MQQEAYAVNTNVYDQSVVDSGMVVSTPIATAVLEDSREKALKAKHIRVVDLETGANSSPDELATLSPISINEYVQEFSLIPLQEWEGYVVSIDKDSFTAHIQDLTNEDGIEKEEAEFLIEDICDDDLNLLKLGALFRWTIGYLYYGGTKTRNSQIIFRRLPTLTKKIAAKADKKAKELANNISWA